MHDIKNNIWVSVYLWDLEDPYSWYYQTTMSADFLDWTPEVTQKIYSNNSSKRISKDFRRGMPFYHIKAERLLEQFKIKNSFWTYTVFWKYFKSLKESFNSWYEYYPDKINDKDIKRKDFLWQLLKIISDNVIQTEEYAEFLNSLNSEFSKIETKFCIDEEDFFDKLELKIKDSIDKPSMNLSTFWSSFIYKLLLNFFKVISKNIPWAVFLFEAPERYLDQKSQIELFSSLQDLSKTSQVIIVTNSTSFVDLSSPNTIIKLDNYSWNWTDFRQTYFEPKKSSSIEKLQSMFPEIKSWLLYDKIALVSDIDIYYKLKKYWDNLFYIYSSSLYDDLEAIFNDLWIFTLHIKNKEDIDKFDSF